MTEEQEYIELTPTWASIMPVHIYALEHGETDKGKQAARDEIMRLARAYDALSAKFKDQGGIPE